MANSWLEVETKPKNIFGQALELLKEYRFSLALKLVSEGAWRYKLYNDYRKDFANIRLLAFEAHDFELAAEKLTTLLRKLSNEISAGGNQR